MKETKVLEPNSDRQEVFDVCGYALEHQGYNVTREGDVMKGDSGNIFLRKIIYVTWREDGIIIDYKGSKFIMESDVELLVNTIRILNEAMASGNFTDEHRIFNFSNKRY